MTQERRIRFGAVSIIAMGAIGLLIPKETEATQPFHCDAFLEVASCDYPAMAFAASYCSGCNLPVACGGLPGSYWAWCDHEIR